MKIPRFMIAGTHSGVGKTTITTGIMAALASAGFKVQPYKVGPDYIDPTYHTMATGNKSRNLDTWILDNETVKKVFVKSASKADIAVIEGVMGVFDGSSGTVDQGSSAHMAKLIDCPVILIVDTSSMARSAAALVSGFLNFDPDLKIAGVILNKIGSERHLKLVTEAIETYCNIPVVGYVKKNAALELPSRHLGLVPTVEGGELPRMVNSLAGEISKGIDINKLTNLAMAAPELPDDILDTCDKDLVSGIDQCKTNVRIGIALDEAFSFYYYDGLEVLEEKGAELVPFSPLHDQALPENLDGLYIGGGFPEIFIKELSWNMPLMREIKLAGAQGMPVFAECGGLMYLSREIVDFDGKRYQMTGLVPGACIMENKLIGMGYVEAESLSDNVIAPKGKKTRGHEFHYSRIEPTENSNFKHAFRLVRSRYQQPILDGYANGCILASYVHLHFASDPELAERLIQHCNNFKKNRLRKCIDEN
ncbi:cobyrinate a,c-diamide synthase [Phosphitispora sp. TUW77]|uniref:cobyrinate a,c-diamide synthase n=1 Tax=Phosphitispora sp. TUW77 TaxID=3152361 RepID=UPI003AB2E4EF